MTFAKQSLLKTYWLLSAQFGIDPLRLIRFLRGLPRFIFDWWEFRKSYNGLLVWMPCLHDRYEEGGITKSEYFWQDLLVARWIYEATPRKHVDVGSRVDGFVAHVASFREIEVLDVRPITTRIPGVIFQQVDLMDAASLQNTAVGDEYCDSLSCLHTLEHFGLGRYGDPINPHGYIKGMQNMARLLRIGGKLYLSTPIGKERVEFNANWVFDPRTILNSAKKFGLELNSLTIFRPSLGVEISRFDEATLDVLAQQSYNLGIFTFTKIANSKSIGLSSGEQPSL